METRLQELKNDTVKSDIMVSELLIRAKILAYKIKDKDFIAWVEKEINGYSQKDEVPEYRVARGEPRGWNPYRNEWIPMFNENPETQELLSQRGISQSVLELESFIDGNEKSIDLHIPYPSQVQISFSKSVGLYTKFSLIIPFTAVYRVLNAVRNKLVDWLIKIDTDGGKRDSDISSTEVIFPEELIAKLPADVKLLADDFNFNFSHARPKTCALILRRMLPLSIVRKYQKDNRETEIKGTDGDYLDTKALIGKAQSLLSQGRIYSDLITYKMLTDGAQHSYTLNVQIPDARGASIALRVFLDDIF